MISQFFIERPRFAIVIAIVFVIAGLISIAVLPVAQYPNITPPMVQISANYPGADADTVLKTIVQPIESDVNGVKRMLYISSTSADNGAAVINVTFDIGSDGDINTVNVQNRETQAQPRLPAEVKAQGVTVQEKASNMLLVVTLYSPKGTFDSIFLSNYIYNYIQDEILRIPGVGSTNVLGAAEYSMRIWLDPARMASMKISVDDVIAAIKAQNTQVASGALGDAPTPPNQAFRYILQSQGRLEDVAEFENILIKGTPNGANVKIKDIARVELGGQNYFSDGTLNGKAASLLAVYQLNEGNGMQIAAACKAKLEELKKRFPDDLEYGIQYDTTKFISASIHEVVLTLFEAVALVVLVTWLFLQDWRSTLVPTIAIPVSLIGTFAFLKAGGYTINLISLFGLVLAIGIVVDDAIVVIENVNRLMEEEKLSPKEAAKKTMIQVTGPVVATTLVLLAMFIPVCFLPGITGEMYRQFGVTISVSVLISSINALTLSPALCATLLRAEKPRPFFLFRWFNVLFNGITRGYTSVVTSLVRKAAIVLLLYVGLIALTGKIYTLLPTGFIPSEDQGAFMVNVQLPDGASMPRTQKIVNRAVKMMMDTPGVNYALATTGYSIITGVNAPNTAFLIGVLKPWDQRETPELSQKAIIAAVAKKFATIPGAVIVPFEVPAIPGLGTTGGFSFVLEDTTGTHIERLSQAMNAVISEATGRPELMGVFSPFRAGVPRVFLDIDREKALKLGVTIDSINTALQGLEGYTYVNDFNKFGQVYQVEIQANENYRTCVEDLDSIYIPNSSGGMVPLTTLATARSDFGPQYINRYNLYASVTINGSAAPGYSSGQAMKVMEEIADQVLPEGMKYDWTDISYQERLSGNQTAYVFALALLFIYLFLVAQYESWMIPLAVMLSVPIAFFGALLFLLFRGLDNNIYTQVGFVLLFGLASKTAILIVEFAKEQRAQGMGLFDSAVFAAKLRFRAVVMTALSFILGVMPLVTAMGAGASSRRCLGTAVFGGMLISCLFGTFLIPSFFVVIQWLVEKFGKKKPVAEGAVPVSPEPRQA